MDEQESLWYYLDMVFNLLALRVLVWKDINFQ